MKSTRNVMGRVLGHHIWFLRAFIPHVAAISIRVLGTRSGGQPVLKFFGSAGFDPPINRRNKVDLEGTVAGEALARKSYIFVPDIISDDRFADGDRKLAQQQNLKTVIAAPLIYAGESIGTLMIYSRESYQMNNKIRECLEHLIPQATDFVKLQMIPETMIKIDEGLVSTNQEAAFNRMARETAILFASTGAVIYSLMDDEHVKLVAGYAASGLHRHGKKQIFLIDKTTPFLRCVLNSKEPVIIPGDNLELKGIYDIKHLQGTLSLMVSPIMIQDDVSGFIVVNQSPNREEFTEEDIDVLKWISARASFLLTELKYQKLLAACRSSNITSVLAAKLVHTLGNSLTAIGPFARRFVERKDVPEDLVESGRIICEETLKLEKWSGELTEFFKLKRVYPMIEGEIINWLEKLIKDIRETDKAKGKQIISELSDVKIRTDFSWEILSDAFRNIIFNALEAIQSGESVSVRAFFRDSDVVISFTNPGEIPESVLAHVFDLFYSTKKKGTGIGLAQAIEVFERHEWELSCNSEDGKTIFEVIIPSKKILKRL